MISILDESYALATERLKFLIEEAERITEILRRKLLCSECAVEGLLPISPSDRARLSREFRDLCKAIYVEVENIADATDPEAATRAALANESLPAHVRAAILAANEGKFQPEPEGEQ